MWLLLSLFINPLSIHLFFTLPLSTLSLSFLSLISLSLSHPFSLSLSPSLVVSEFGASDRVVKVTVRLLLIDRFWGCPVTEEQE